MAIREWAQGVIGRFGLGFTEGQPLGFQCRCLLPLLGIQSDTGTAVQEPGHCRVFFAALQQPGQAEDNYSKHGGAGGKTRFMDYEIKVGERLPVSRRPIRLMQGFYRRVFEVSRGPTASVEGLSLQAVSPSTR